MDIRFVGPQGAFKEGNYLERKFMICKTEGCLSVSRVDLLRAISVEPSLETILSRRCHVGAIPTIG